MLHILLNGCYGRLSGAIIEFAQEQPNVQIIAGIDPGAGRASLPFPVYQSLNEAAGIAPDVILDCSLPAALPKLLEYAIAKKLPLVIATTGYGEAESAMIDEAAKQIPVFQSGNMSLGIALLQQLARQTAQVLGESFDVEIIEAHHNKKIDAPSGTALILGGAVNEGLTAPRAYEFNRQPKREARPKEEIGIHSVRGGTITGEHTVLFAGFDEVIELTHKAYSKRIFAVGAVNAARFITKCKPGRYAMADMVNPCESNFK